MARRGRRDQEQPPAEAPPAPHVPEMANPGEDLITVLRGLAHHFTTARNQQPQPPDPRDTLTQVVEQFCRFNPPVFNGREEPAVAEEWLRALERIFTHIACTDAQKVSCAIFQMTEDADHWWESYCRTRTQQQIGDLTWQEFKDVVIQNYLPLSYREKKRWEFIHLKQGSMTVIEYERKFNQLSRYATSLVSTEYDKARCFEQGLRRDRQISWQRTKTTTYADIIVERALEIAD
ncbi:hypothetical protein DH2020_003877 [Rehmannia glutinosa]|uniref:Retrotransposon gag domain-containing protein n=1 Tax=Rehmannia glutinosa TaxID=99300 RepID=A0ABR0XMW1_REHGL